MSSFNKLDILKLCREAILKKSAHIAYDRCSGYQKREIGVQFKDFKITISSDLSFMSQDSVYVFIDGYTFSDVIVKNIDIPAYIKNEKIFNELVSWLFDHKNSIRIAHENLLSNVTEALKEHEVI